MNRRAMSLRRIPHLGFLLVWLALSVQLALGALVPPVVGPLALTDDIPLCHGGDDTNSPAPTAPHHPADCLVCPLCTSLAVPWVLPVSDPPAPSPNRSLAIAHTAMPPPATGPPAPVRFIPQPRAQPVQA
jgi:hypothetical protein